MSSYLTLHVIESVCEENNSREKLKNMILYSDTTINDKWNITLSCLLFHLVPWCYFSEILNIHFPFSIQLNVIMNIYIFLTCILCV